MSTTAASSSRKLVRALYKSLLGSARLIDGQPAKKALIFRNPRAIGKIIEDEEYEEAKEAQFMDQWYTQVLGSQEAHYNNPQIANSQLSDVVRQNFKANAHLSDPASLDALTEVASPPCLSLLAL